MNSTYLKNITGLLGSNIISQIILLLSLPAVALLYGPEEFGKFGLVISLVSIFSILSLLKSDAYLVSLEKANKYHRSVFLKSVLLSTGILITIVIVSKIISDLIFKVESTELIFNWQEYFYIFLIVMFFNFFQLSSSIFVNKNKVFKIAQVNVIRSILLVLFQLSFGSFKVTFGLWYAEFLSRCGQCLIMFPELRQLLKKNKNNEIDNTWKFYFNNLKPYSLFTMPASLISTLTQYLPVFFTASIIGLKAAGLYFMASRLITIPIGMLAQSVSKAFVAEYVQTAEENKFRLIRNTLISLFSISSIIVLVFYFISPLLIKLEPEGWKGIINVTVIISFVAIPILTVSSISQLFNLLGIQKLLLITECIKLLCVLSVLIVFSEVDGEVNNFYIMLVISIALGYLIQVLSMIPTVFRLIR